MGADGGILCKLSPFVSRKVLEGYTYLEAETNLDFEPLAKLSRYNCLDKDAFIGGNPSRSGTIEEYKVYSNICGLLAFSDASDTNIKLFYDAIQSSLAAGFKPAYD